MKRKQAYRALLCPGKSNQFLLILFFFSVLSLSANCQFYEPSEQTIRIGETLPESFYQTIHTAVDIPSGSETTLKLATYRDKLIILDFWATWCGPCIHSLNKLDSISATINRDDLVIIPVTYETPQKAALAFDRFRWDMTTIICDTILAQIFPHNGIPHQVWIKDGKVIAMPKWDYATVENIRKTINGQHVEMVMETADRILDPSKPMFVTGNGEIRPYYKTKYSRITRYVPGFREEKLQYLQKGDTTILYANNLSIRELFYQAYENKIFPSLSGSTIGNMQKGIRWEISDKLKKRFFSPPKASSTGNIMQDSIYQVWIKQNRYGYELRYPGKLSKSEALDFMQEDLNKLFKLYFNIEAAIEKGPRHKYLVLRLLDSVEEAERLLQTNGGPTRQNHSDTWYRSYNSHFKWSFLTWLSAARLLPDLTLKGIVNMTDLPPDFRVDVEFPKAIKGNLKLAQQELARYGLRLTVEDQRVPILVIREKNVGQ